MQRFENSKDQGSRIKDQGSSGHFENALDFEEKAPSAPTQGRWKVESHKPEEYQGEHKENSREKAKRKKQRSPCVPATKSRKRVELQREQTTSIMWNAESRIP